MKKILTLPFLLLYSIYSFAQTNTATGTNAGGTGSDNSSFGYVAGDVISGTGNTFIGSNSGRAATSSLRNTFVGYYSGKSVLAGGYNTLVGSESGYSLTSGTNNTFLGQASGYMTTGSSNVFIGYMAGYNETGSNKLYIDNSNTGLPLIYGDFNTNQVGINVMPGLYTLNVGGSINANSITIGNTPVVSSQWTASGSNLTYNTTGTVSIGTTLSPAGFKLAIGGKMICEEVVVKLQVNWADYVFEKDYELPGLLEVEKFVRENKHLPGVPTAEDVRKDGISVGEMNVILLRKIEELTLYAIELKKEVVALKNSNN
jgi:hypothetical protein